MVSYPNGPILAAINFKPRHGRREEKSDMVAGFASSDCLNYSALTSSSRPYKILSVFDGDVVTDNGALNDEVAETQSSCSRR